MEPVNIIRDIIQELVHLRLDKGVSPQELSNNIFEEGYQEVRIQKIFEEIHCILTFVDNDMFSDKRIKIKYKYIYNQNQYLQQILNISNKNVLSIWNRDEEEMRLIKLIEDQYLLMEKTSDELGAFLRSLPEDLQTLLSYSECKTGC
ncbi:hypothetical protein JJB07_04550 [Tumebacillus sp. ITR2]|uniref:Uncharacterized protein n=1 Tax=Tumebacillus amylolyticus TaxID=2801339 RepID=A0ABS1J6M2_9BACL|nr:hypothetical protein [Tumebacillus amylolyticus]MBL0385914.1 hypothetical protein [Tumebacillus amylolyticus]